MLFTKSAESTNNSLGNLNLYALLKEGFAFGIHELQKCFSNNYDEQEQKLANPCLEIMISLPLISTSALPADKRVTINRE